MATVLAALIASGIVLVVLAALLAALLLLLPRLLAALLLIFLARALLALIAVVIVGHRCFLMRLDSPASNQLLGTIIVPVVPQFLGWISRSAPISVAYACRFDSQTQGY